MQGKVPKPTRMRGFSHRLFHSFGYSSSGCSSAESVSTSPNAVIVKNSRHNNNTSVKRKGKIVCRLNIHYFNIFFRRPLIILILRLVYFCCSDRTPPNHLHPLYHVLKQMSILFSIFSKIFENSLPFARWRDF